MRTQKTLKNSIYIIGSYLTLGILSVLTRKMFIMYLPLEFLGYEELFGNIFSILSLTDLGIGTLITYRLYPAFAKEDKKEIAKLMSIYKYLFRIIGVIVLGLGLFLIPFLRSIVKGNSLEWEYIYIVYIMQLSTILCTYFLAYKRILYTVDQCEYKSVQIETMCSFVGNLIRIAIILIFKNYILYLAVNILTNIITNCIISARINKEYDYIHITCSANKKDLVDYRFVKDIKNNLAQKISLVIYGGTDNILISALLDIKYVAIKGNYSLITGYVTKIMDKVLDSFQAPIGNFIYSNNRKEGTKLFRMFELISFVLANFVATSYFIMLNPLMEIWLGTGFVLNEGYVLAFALNEYVKWNHKFIVYYRNAFGKYELDRNYILGGAILNIACSVVLAKPLGISGIMLGTVVGHFGFWIGRTKVVYREYLDEKSVFYALRQIRNFIIMISNCILLKLFCHYISDDLKGFMIKIDICLFLPNVITLFIFYKSEEMKMIFSYLHILSKILKK